MALTPSNLRRVLFLRVGASILTFCVFAILAVSWVVTSDPTLKWVLFIPLLGSVLLLPRKLPQTVGGDLDEDSPQMRILVRTGYWLSIVRVVYLLIAIAVLFALPELMN